MTLPDDIVLEGFGGPGGWPTGARALGIRRSVGIELDAAACQTRRSAGHLTVRADVSTFPVEQLAGKVWGSVNSPPCTTYSAAGDQAGNALLEMLAALTADMLAGRDTRAKYRREMAAELTRSEWRADLTPEVRAAKITRSVASAALVAEPARFIVACRPEWVALEQVPAVLPLWQVYAAELRRMGYSAWCGKLNAADYGVPQVRERAILIASRAREVSRPEPTHYDDRKAMQLWGSPWISMADALGWGATGRPGVTVTSGGTATGGAEPFGHRGRDALEAEQEAGRWALRRSRGAGMLDREGRGGRRDHPADEPAPTITSAGSKVGANLSWVLRTSYGQPGDTPRNGTHEMNPAERPAHTVTGKVKDWAAWTVERPATTVCGRGELGRPGHKDRSAGGEPHFAVDSVRITIEEAAILQSFPADYPWQGSKTKRFEQCGNAVPPLLAEHVLSMATGIKRLEAAA